MPSRSVVSASARLSTTRCAAAALVSLAIGCAARTPPARTATLPDGVSYCGDDIELVRNDVACLQPLSEELSRKREEGFKLTRARGKVVRVDALGPITGDKWRRWDLVYDGDRLREERKTTTSGALLCHGIFERGGARVVYRDASGAPLLHWGGDDESAYNVVERTFGDDGFVRTKRFMTLSGNPGTDDEGVHEYRYRKDERGHTVEFTGFDAKGKPIGMGLGVHKVVLTYRDDQAETLARFDVNGHLTWSGRNGPYETIVRDRDGNKSVVRHLDEKKQVVAEARFRVDHAGRIVQQTITDATRWPGRGATVTTTEYLSNGYLSRLIETTPDETSTTDVEWDEHGNLSRLRWYGADDKLTGGKFIVNDDAGNHLREIFVGEDGEVSAFEDLERDEHGRLTKRRFFTPFGQPDTSKACPTIRYLYDGDGFNARITCHDERDAMVDVIVYRLLEVSTEDRPAWSTDRARAHATEALDRLHKGERFIDLVDLFDTRSYRDRPLERRLLRRDIEQRAPLWKAVQALEVGADTGVVEVEDRFYIVVRER